MCNYAEKDDSTLTVVYSAVSSSAPNSRLVMSRLSAADVSQLELNRIYFSSSLTLDAWLLLLLLWLSMTDNNLMNHVGLSYDYFGPQDFINCCKDLVIDVTVAKRASSRALKNIVFNRFRDETLV